jgi:hypothetical protein
MPFGVKVSAPRLCGAKRSSARLFHLNLGGKEAKAGKI